MAIQNQGWAYVSGSSTVTPGGSDTNIQFNNNGVLSGSSLLITDGSGSISGSTTIQGASLSVDGAVTAGTFHGDGSGLTNISSDDVDTTTDTTNATRYIPFVDQATGADGESLLIHSAVSINPSTGVFTVAGMASMTASGSPFLTVSPTAPLQLPRLSYSMLVKTLLPSVQLAVVRSLQLAPRPWVL